MKFLDNFNQEILCGDQIIFVDWGSLKTYTKLKTGIVTDKRITSANVPSIQIDGVWETPKHFMDSTKVSFEQVVKVTPELLKDFESKKQAIPDRIVVYKVKSTSSRDRSYNEMIARFEKVFLKAISNNQSKMTVCGYKFYMRITKKTIHAEFEKFYLHPSACYYSNPNLEKDINNIVNKHGYSWGW